MSERRCSWELLFVGHNGEHVQRDLTRQQRDDPEFHGSIGSYGIQCGNCGTVNTSAPPLGSDAPWLCGICRRPLMQSEPDPPPATPTAVAFEASFIAAEEATDAYETHQRECGPCRDHIDCDELERLDAAAVTAGSAHAAAAEASRAAWAARRRP